MGGTSTSPVAASLTERLKPQCLAMCGVCAGNPSEVALGDVILAEMVYPYNEGKHTEAEFEGDHRQIPMQDSWVRAAQELVPEGLPSFCEPTTADSRSWLLERLYAGEDPRSHPASPRYFPRGTWTRRVRAFEKDHLVRRTGQRLVLTAKGKRFAEDSVFYRGKNPDKLPFQIKVGPIASGNAVVKDGTVWARLKRLGVRSILGLEMEAANIGTIAHRLGLKNWVVAKGVMDHADPRKDDRYKQFAARASAEVLFKFLLNQLMIAGSETGEVRATQIKPAHVIGGEMDDQQYKEPAISEGGIVGGQRADTLIGDDRREDVLTALTFVVSAVAEAGLSGLGLSKEALLGSLRAEFVSHPILARIDYELTPRPLSPTLFVLLTKRGTHVSVEHVGSQFLSKKKVTLWSDLCQAYLHAYNLPFRSDHICLMREVEFRRTMRAMKGVLAALTKYIYQAELYHDQRAYPHLHKLKQRAEASYLKAEELYAHYLQSSDDSVIGKVALELDLIVSSAHKIAIEYRVRA
jgi:nucleoside phosphorylase